MEVYVNMDKPKNCYECIVKNPYSCLPAHGRLIDADALEDELSQFCNDNWVYNTLHHAPTIIPAEKVSGNSGELENKP